MKFTFAKHKRIAITAAIASSSLVVLPSCNIPCLRGPQPQAMLPQAYPAGNNGVVSEQDDDGEIQDVPINPADQTLQPVSMTSKSDALSASDASVDGSVTFASFLKNSGELDIKDDGTAAELSTDAMPDVPDDSYLSTRKSEMVSVDIAEPISPIDGIINLNTASSGGATGSDVTAAVVAIDNASELNPDAYDETVYPNTVPLDVDGTTPELEFDSVSMDFGPAIPQNSALFGWHDFFGDPNLSALIAQAMTGNQELKILAENIQIANNRVLARSGAYRPFLSFGAGAGVEKPSLFTPLGAAEEQLQPLPGVNFPDPLPNFLMAANLSWQIDIWNQLHNAQYAACLRYLGTRDGWNYVVTRMVSEVAENYYELMALDNQMETLDATIALQEKSLETSKSMMAQARGNQLAVQRFQAEVRKNQSKKLIIQQQIVEAENRINFLLGRYPQPVQRSSVKYIDLNLQALNVGVPSDLLRNRSDIRQAERELRAAGLDIKVARANFYPALTLTGGVGFEAFNPRYMFWTPEALIYNLAGGLVAPLVNKRAIQAEYKTANARQLQAVYEYQRTILQAFTEVTNSMTKVENYRKSIEDKKLQLEALIASIDSATALFQNARGEYLDVLLAQRDMNEAKMVLIETKQQQLTAAVDAYQALGGGGVLAGYQ
ncbi:TolC family protein [Allorhodopirellula heiligendammensis]|nr:TolC family protein [Allorhodopirellula heiligendammensis]